MSDQYSMFDLATCGPIVPATSSPGSVDGPTRSGLPDGPMTTQSGPAPVPVSRFRARESDEAMLTNDTSGPLFNTSSPSAALQWSLANRLRQRMGGSGSVLFALTWRDVDMLSGVPICQLAVSARRIGGNGFGSWQTPKAKTGEYQYSNGDHGKPFLNLEGQVQLASRPTPQLHDAERGGQEKRVTTERHGSNLQDFAMTATTPTSRDHKDGASTLENTPVNALLGRQVPGTISSGSLAPTKKRGQLNPDFSRWLMGYPAEWLFTAPESKAVPRFRKSTTTRGLARLKHLETRSYRK